MTVLIHSIYTFPYNLDWLGRCRWSTNSDEPLLFVKYHDNLLDILDVEKKVLTLKSSIQLDLGSKCSNSSFTSFSFTLSRHTRAVSKILKESLAFFFNDKRVDFLILFL